MKYDIAVIGAGPGGYTAAIRAAQLGKKVVLIEKGELGGTCLNWGCIPTKCIQYSTKLYSKIKKSSYFGINTENVSLDYGKIIDRKDRIVGQLKKGLQLLFKENHVEVMLGEATLVDKNTISVNGTSVEADNIILATGSTTPNNFSVKIDEKKVFSSTGILNLKTPPKTLAIIGAGAIGIEMACIMNESGSKVSVFEMMSRVLPLEDKEISIALESSLSRKGITINCSSKFESSDAYEAVLVSIGRTLNTKGFAEFGLQMDKAKVKVNEFMQTSTNNIYAIGDIAGKYMLAHTAEHEGIVAVEHICGALNKIDYTAVPKCTYSDPGVASVGLTEEEARAKFGEVKTGKFPFSANSKSLIEDERDGFIKIVTDMSDNVVGVHMIGTHATELISEAALAVQKKMRAQDIVHTIHAHPTVYESIYEAAENVFKHSIAMPNK
jgi:dihydrolipoamide dehydrogenase